MSAHLLFLQARTTGGIVQGNNLTIYSADNTSSCNTSYYYREGFPERSEYLLSEVICDQQQGILTVDTRGEDLLVVDLDRFSGGSVSHINKVRAMLCQHASECEMSLGRRVTTLV